MWFTYRLNINIFNLMSQVKTIDGQTGELVGGSNTYGYTQVSSSNAGYGNTVVSGGNVGYTTTTTTQPVQYTTTTTTQQPVTTYATSSNVVGGTQYVSGGGYTTSAVNSGYVAGSSHVQGGHEAQIVNTVVNTGKEVIKGESRIEYVPFEKKVVAYKD